MRGLPTSPIPQISIPVHEATVNGSRSSHDQQNKRTLARKTSEFTKYPLVKKAFYLKCSRSVDIAADILSEYLKQPLI